jgi:hypothetical protein
MTTNLVVSPQTPNTELIDSRTGKITWAWLKFFMGLAQAVNEALTILGVFNGVIGPSATVEGHSGTLQATVQNLTATGELNAAALTGIVGSAQLPPAIPSAQGAVQLPTGASTNVLGTAAFDDATAFDPAGSAATAQANAETFATAGDATTLAAAKGYTNSKVIVGLSVTIATAQLTTLGSGGSMTFSNGVLTAQTPAT